jgi:CBS domain containing-hemolysin-like protein
MGMAQIDVAVGLLAVLALILANAFFVLAEFSLVSADRGKLDRLAREGHTRAARALQALKSLSFQLSGAQLGITASSLILGAIAEPTIGRLIGPGLEALGLPPRTSLVLSIAGALILATATQMVVGELVPKNLAISRSVGVVLAVSRPLLLYNRIFSPLVVFFNDSADWTVRKLGIEPREELTSVRSLEELELLIASSRAHGALPEEEAELLARSISFRDKSAADVLVPRTALVALDQDATVADLAAQSTETGHSRFPVYRNDLDDILGFAHVKDVHRIPPGKRSATRVADIVQDALVVPETRPVDSLLLEMRRERKPMALIVDEYGGTAGVATLEDLVEELVGEIEDEYDPKAPPGLTRAPTGIHLVSGILRPDELEEKTGFVMPDGDYETFAGFLLALLGHIPAQGEHASYEGWEFKVVETQERRISKVLVVAPVRIPERSESGEPE